jgi:chorismate dehydratase
MTKPYIAASSYLNAAPLCYSFIYGGQKGRCRFLSDAAPARCAELLVEGRADAALIPVIEYQRIAGLKIVPGPCVASKASVRSVLLASRVPIAKVRSVALDTSSRTSAALIQIILGRFYGLRPTYRTSPPRIAEMLESDDAALIIGDPAMLIDRSSLYVYDLAEEWRKHTGLPFVFAFWAVRSDSTAWAENQGARDKSEPAKAESLIAESYRPSTLRVDFLGARREGIEHTNELADIYSAQLGLPRDELISYLTKNISYDLDEESLGGLKLYYEMAQECGLIQEVRRLVFCQ